MLGLEWKCKKAAEATGNEICSHKDLTLKRLQFSDFKFKMNVCHPREMDVVQAEITKWMTANF